MSDAGDDPPQEVVVAAAAADAGESTPDAAGVEDAAASEGDNGGDADAAEDVANAGDTDAVKCDVPAEDTPSPVPGGASPALAVLESSPQQEQEQQQQPEAEKEGAGTEASPTPPTPPPPPPQEAGEEEKTVEAEPASAPRERATGAPAAEAETKAEAPPAAQHADPVAAAEAESASPVSPAPPRRPGLWWVSDLTAAVKARSSSVAVRKVEGLVLALQHAQHIDKLRRGEITRIERENDELVRGIAGSPGAATSIAPGATSAPDAVRKYVMELQDDNQKLKDRNESLEAKQKDWVDAADSALTAQRKMENMKHSMAEMRGELDRLIPLESKSESLTVELDVTKGELSQLRREQEDVNVVRKRLTDENARLQDAAMVTKKREAAHMNELMWLERRTQELMETIRHLETTGGGGGGGGGSGISKASFRDDTTTPAQQHFTMAQDIQMPAVQVPQVLKRCTQQAHIHDVNAIDVAPNGRFFATGSSDKHVKIWDVSTFAEQASLNAAVSAVLRVQYNNTGDVLAAGTSDGSVVLWNTQTSRHMTSLCGHSQKITGVCFDMDKTLLTCSGDRTIRRWDLSKNHCTKTTMLWSNAVDLAAGGSLVASAHHDGGLRFWDHRTVSAAEEMKAVHSQPLTSVAFSSDSNRVLTTSKDGTIKLIDTRTFNTITTVDLRYFAGIHASSKACFSPDDSFMAVGLNTDNERGGVVQVYDTRSRPKMRASLAGSGAHADRISQVCWAVDGSVLLSAGLDGTVASWGPG